MAESTYPTSEDDITESFKDPKEIQKFSMIVDTLIKKFGGLKEFEDEEGFVSNEMTSKKYIRMIHVAYRTGNPFIAGRNKVFEIDETRNNFPVDSRQITLDVQEQNSSETWKIVFTGTDKQGCEVEIMHEQEGDDGSVVITDYILFSEQGEIDAVTGKYTQDDTGVYNFISEDYNNAISQQEVENLITTVLSANIASTNPEIPNISILDIAKSNPATGRRLFSFASLYN